MLRREDGKQIKKLLEAGLNATEFKEWTNLHNSERISLKVDYYNVLPYQDHLTKFSYSKYL